VIFLSSTDIQIPSGVYQVMIINLLVDTPTSVATASIVQINSVPTALIRMAMQQARATSMRSSSKACSLPTITASGSTAAKTTTSLPETASSAQSVYSWRL